VCVCVCEYIYTAAVQRHFLMQRLMMMKILSNVYLTHTHTYTHTQRQTYMHACLHTYTHTYTLTYRHIRIHTHTQICIEHIKQRVRVCTLGRGHTERKNERYIIYIYISADRLATAFEKAVLSCVNIIMSCQKRPI